jgi:phage/plasmid-associated DNA primase
VATVANGVAISPPSDERISQYIQGTTKAGEVTELNHMYIADDLSEKYHTISFQDELFIYDPVECIYVKATQHIEKEVRAIAAELQYTGSISKAISETMKYVKYKHVEHFYPFNNASFMLPLQNGILKIEFSSGNAELIPHDPKHLFTFKLPIVYDPTASSDNIHKILSSWVEQEDIELLYQIPAQAILQMMIDNSYKKNYILHGEPHAGKSTYLKLLELFFGRDNFCHVSLHQIGKDQFCTGNLENKMLNIYDDLSDIPLENVGEFKNLTGATHHKIESKHIQAYEGRIYAVHIFACNKPPSVPETILYDPAFWERFEIIKFPFFFQVDPIFKDLSFNEANMSGYLNQVVKHIIRIVKERKLMVNRDAEQVMARWNELSNPLVQFFKDNIRETTPASKTNLFDKYKLYNEYVDFCRVGNVNPKKIIPSVEAFTRAVQPLGLQPFETREKSPHSDKRISIKCYRGSFEWIKGQAQMGVEINESLIK